MPQIATGWYQLYHVIPQAVSASDVCAATGIHRDIQTYCAWCGMAFKNCAYRLYLFTSIL